MPPPPTNSTYEAYPGQVPQRRIGGQTVEHRPGRVTADAPSGSNLVGGGPSGGIDLDQLNGWSPGEKLMRFMSQAATSIVPIFGELQDLATIADRSNPTWVRAASTVSLAVGVLTWGLSPNVGSISDDLVRFVDDAWTGGLCFSEGTLVHTREGLRPIEEIAVGELVWSRDDSTGEMMLRPVSAVFVTADQPLLEVTLYIPGQDGSDRVQVTPEHPFQTEHGWVAARDLQDHSVLVRSGEWAEVILVRSSTKLAKVYNIEIDNLHTYFVGLSGALVHNACNDPIASRGGMNQIDDAASAATTVGRRGQQVNFPNANASIPRNAPGTIGGRDFSGHALDRMQERGIMPSAIENAIRHGASSPGTAAGTTRYFDAANKFNVVVDSASGRIVTVF